MKIGVPREIIANETRVALVPDHVAQLKKKGIEIIVESGAGLASSFLDEAYEKAGATIVTDPATLFAQSDVVSRAAFT